MRLKELKVCYLIIITSLSSFSTLAQEFEFSVYLRDSTARRPLVRAKVKSVIELSTLPNGKIRTRGFYFNKMGRLTATYFPGYGPKLTKVAYEYYPNGELKKQSHFDQKDTTKLVEWKDFEYSKEGDLVKETITNVDAFGKYHSMITQNEKPVTSNHKTVRKQIVTNMGLPPKTIISIDSTDNEYHYRIVDMKSGAIISNDQNSIFSGRKSIVRTSSKDRMEIKDVFSFSTSNNVTNLLQFNRTHVVFDSGERKIETVKTSYKDALNNYGYPRDVLQYPRDESKTLQLVDQGKVEGEILATIKYLYDDRGLLSEMDSVVRKIHYITKLRYNAKDELIELEKSFNKRILYAYNERGLISSVSFYEVLIGTVKEVLRYKANYEFEFYD